VNGDARDAGSPHPEEEPARERVVRQPHDPDAPGIGVDETDDPIPEPNEPA
jgi:hypothetical protein